MKKIILVLLLFLCNVYVHSQSQTENLIIITFDGLRWQELFGGADSVLIANKNFTEDSADIVKKFWAPSFEERRKKLFPFIWSTVATQGQLHGNRFSGNKMNVMNPYRISYPGYNEIFTGYPDKTVNTNDKIYNKNKTVLEFLNEQPRLKNKVAVFTSWDVFNFIFNEKKNSLPVNAGVDKVAIQSPRFDLLNQMQQACFQPFGDGIRPDLLTYYLAKEYLITKKPKVLYIGFDDTDDWAHNGKYDYYLQSAHLTDGYIMELWNLLQSMPEYKNKTTLVLTTDHGRGDVVKKDWTSHGKNITGADEIWIGFLGNGIAAKEAKQGEQLYQAQIAQTIAALLGYTFTANHPVEKSMEGSIRK